MFPIVFLFIGLFYFIPAKADNIYVHLITISAGIFIFMNGGIAAIVASAFNEWFSDHTI